MTALLSVRGLHTRYAVGRQVLRADEYGFFLHTWALLSALSTCCIDVVLWMIRKYYGF